MNPRDRLAAVVADLGAGRDEIDVEALVGLVERIDATLAGASAHTPLGWGGEEESLPEPSDAVGPGPLLPGPPPPGARPPNGSGWAWHAPGGGLPPTGSGPLDGWRLAVKDLVAVAGRARRCGSAATYDARPEPHDAPVVAASRGAGARLVGTTSLHEFAFGTTGVNAAFGTPANPADPRRVPGGSSSGAAVVVAGGGADLSIGTDTGGSVRIPAALCGVVGYKPTFGALPTAGVWPLSPTLDHVGYLVASADRLAAPARALGLDAGAAATVPTSRLGVARGAPELCSEEVRLVFEAALRALREGGFELVDVDWPGGEEVFAATTAIMFAEAALVHRRLLQARHQLYGPDVRARLVQGLALDAVSYVRARELRGELRRRCGAVLRDVAAVVTPTVPVVAPLASEASDPAVTGRLVTFTRLADVTGLPALSLPVPGRALPVGVQLEAADDPTILQLAPRVAALLGGP